MLTKAREATAALLGSIEEIEAASKVRYAAGDNRMGNVLYDAHGGLVNWAERLKERIEWLAGMLEHADG